MTAPFAFRDLVDTRRSMGMAMGTKSPERFPLPEDEAERLSTLREYGPPQRLASNELSRITKIAARMTGSPTALVSIIEEDEQILPSKFGYEEEGVAREHAFCAHVLVEDDVFVVPDALRDTRFARNPLVSGENGIRFYAGAPLTSPEGHRLGALAVIDYSPRYGLPTAQTAVLRELASSVSDHLAESRRTIDWKRDGGEAERAATRERFLILAETSSNPAFCAGELGSVSYLNGAAGSILKLRLGAAAQTVLPGWDDMIARFRNEKRTKALFVSTATERVGVADGSSQQSEVSISFWGAGSQRTFGVMVHMPSDQPGSLAMAAPLADTDTVTSLPNRQALLNRIQSDVGTDAPIHLLLVSIDAFDEIAEGYGHASADDVLRQAAARLCESAGEAFVARLATDTLAMVTGGGAQTETVRESMETLAKRFEAPFSLDGVSLPVSVTIGAAVAPRDAATAPELLGAAYLALQEARRAGSARQRVFKPALRTDAAERRDLQRELEQAHARSEFALHYQPQLQLPDRKVVGAEALLRWDHPTRGLLGPSQFIDVLSQMQLCAAIDAWTIRTASEAAMRWRELGFEQLTVSVNLFKAQLKAKSLSDTVSSILCDTGLSAEALELEVSEDRALLPGYADEGPLPRLRELGISIALDDFGTGFASLSQLKTRTVQRLKIDRSFVKGMTTNAGDHAVVEAIVKMARVHHLEVIAEGVETTEQEAMLVELGCTLMQGFVFSRPLPPDEFTSFLMKSRAGGKAHPALISKAASANQRAA